MWLWLSERTQNLELREAREGKHGSTRDSATQARCEVNTEARADDDTKPTRRPYALPLENGLRRVPTGSDEHHALVDLGYVPVEQDDVTTIMRRARRATDRTTPATGADLMRFRRLERETWDGIASEFGALGIGITGDQLQWAADVFRARVMKEGNGKTVVSGRLR